MATLADYANSDFQNRGKNAAKSGTPVSITNKENRLIFDFENTSEKDAKKFVSKFCKKIGDCDIDLDKEGGVVTVYAAFAL